MELLIKLYSAQPSRIGIKYIYQFQAVKAYEELIKTGGTAFSLKIEINGQKAKLSLTSSQNGARWEQRELDYKPEMIKKLVSYLKPGMPLHYVHVYSEDNTLFMARAFRKNHVVAIDKFEIVGPGGMDTVSEEQDLYF